MYNIIARLLISFFSSDLALLLRPPIGSKALLASSNLEDGESARLLKSRYIKVLKTYQWTVFKLEKRPYPMLEELLFNISKLKFLKIFRVMQTTQNLFISQDSCGHYFYHSNNLLEINPR